MTGSRDMKLFEAQALKSTPRRILFDSGIRNASDRTNQNNIPDFKLSNEAVPQALLPVRPLCVSRDTVNDHQTVHITFLWKVGGKHKTTHLLKMRFQDSFQKYKQTRFTTKVSCFHPLSHIPMHRVRPARYRARISSSVSV